MNFLVMEDLVDKVNKALGDFCDEFGETRKKLFNLGRAPARGRLFKYIPSERSWSINEGGGIELQYHLAFDQTKLEVWYGLGFNTNYVPFANEKSQVEYMQPYMNSFLRNEQAIIQNLPGYTFLYGSKEDIKSPKRDQYVLFGKSILVEKKTNQFSIEESVFANLIADLKNQFESYTLIVASTMDYQKSN